MTAGELFTIRTSTGLLFGRFESRGDAWAVIERIRRSGQHYESVHGANVVPLLAGVEPKPLHPDWLSDGREGTAGPGSLDRKEILAAVDAFVGAYNDARSLRRGYRYVSGYLLTSDPDLGEAVRVVLAPLYREIGRLTDESDQYRVDSTTLNAVTWGIAQALGEVPPGVDRVEADPVELARRLIGTLERRTAQLEGINEELRQFGIEHQLGRAGVADVCAMATGQLEQLEGMTAELERIREYAGRLRFAHSAFMDIEKMALEALGQTPVVSGRDGDIS